MKSKFTTIYKQDGQTWNIQLEFPSDNMYDYMSQEDYDSRPEYDYYIENERFQLLKCDKDRNIMKK